MSSIEFPVIACVLIELVKSCSAVFDKTMTLLITNNFHFLSQFLIALSRIVFLKHVAGSDEIARSKNATMIFNTDVS
jgi:hypothetical protein